MKRICIVLIVLFFPLIGLAQYGGSAAAQGNSATYQPAVPAPTIVSPYGGGMAVTTAAAGLPLPVRP